MRIGTKVITAGRDPDRYSGAVNPPVYRTSTVLSGTVADWQKRQATRAAGVPGMYYGRHGTLTTRDLEEAFAEIEGGHRSFVCPSGLAACIMSILAFVKSGDHILITDSVYGPVRTFADGPLVRMGVQTTYYDPLIGADIKKLIQPNTTVVYTEAPGSHTLEVQDIPAIAAEAHAAGAVVLMDNTWATPLFFRAFNHGVDVSIQAATKYVIGHSDAMLGLVTTTQQLSPAMERCVHEYGQITSPDDVYLAQRGLRTMQVRLERHWATGVRLARWLAEQREVSRVIHPALPEDKGHALWKRDFLGASGLFSVVFNDLPGAAVDAFIDELELFNIGASWGGFESLILPIDPTAQRTATKWAAPGKAVRIHAGLEDVDDLLEDMSNAFKALRSHC